jgi:superfamily II RNA helicase
MRQGLFPLFRDPNAGPGAVTGVKREDGNNKLVSGAMINPTIIKFEEQFIKNSQKGAFVSGRAVGRTARSNNPQSMVPSYSSLAEELHQLKKLPAIVFIFSRAGCEQGAKMVMQMKTKLLTPDEINYVNLAINAFVKANPEIPVAKASVQMLRAGVGVHHAGLITVWKAFIEDLFNANKIRILFATETLAAGVNMVKVVFLFYWFDNFFYLARKNNCNNNSDKKN